MKRLEFPTPIPFQTVKQMEKKNYDILVVGTGAGGGAVLWRLCKNWRNSDKTIGMIEAGDLVLPTHAYNIPQRKAKWEHVFQEVSHPVGHLLPQFSGAKQVIAVGGRTLFWGAVTPRMHASEFTSWPVSSQEIEAYYKIAEEVMRIDHSLQKRSLHVQAILQHLRSNGFPEARPLPFAISNGLTFSSLCFLQKAWEQHPFDLSVKSRALQVLLENGKPVGLKVAAHDKKLYVLQAKTIILSAGSLESPRLLLHSGLCGKSIGRYLTNHSFIKATGRMIHSTFRNISDNVSLLIPQTKETPFQLQLSITRGSIHAVGFGKVQSNFDNNLSLDPQHLDEYGIPKIKIDFSYSDMDIEIMKQMQRATVQVFKALGAKLTHMQVMEPGSDYHESGTCRIGTDPSQSSTNQYGQIHGTPGLFVADNSILPTIGASNPTLTTVALAIRIADHISYRLTPERLR